MSLITERRRKELESMSKDKLVELIKKKNPGIRDKYARGLVRSHRRALIKKRFSVLADLSKTIDKKSKDLGLTRSTTKQSRSFLMHLGAIEPHEKKLYTKNILVKADKKFSGRESLRKAINRRIKIKEELTLGQIADRFGIPKLCRAGALKEYGTDYQAYPELTLLIRYEVNRENFERAGDEKKYHRKFTYKFVNKLPLASEVKEDTYLNRKRDYLEAVKEMGPCAVRQIQNKLRAPNRSLVNKFIKRLEKEGELISLKRPNSDIEKYDFFGPLFPANTWNNPGRLVLNPNDQGNLRRVSIKLIYCLQGEIYPWTQEHIYKQLNQLKENGLPEGVCDEVQKYISLIISMY